MPTERDLFIDWMESSYPGLGAFVDAMWGDAWADTEHYLHWVNIGKPSGTGGTLTPEQMYEQEMARSESQAAGFDFPDTYSPEAARQRSERLTASINQIDERMEQITGIAAGHIANMISGGQNQDIWNSLTPSTQQMIIDLYRERELIASEMIALKGVAGVGELEALGLEGWMARQPQIAKPYIPTPEWLSPYLQGLGAGEPLTQVGFTTPSAQAWGRMPWHRREMFGGYAEYAGTGRIKTMRDLEEAIAAGIPRRRELTPRWKPAFQR